MNDKMNPRTQFSALAGQLPPDRSVLPAGETAVTLGDGTAVTLEIPEIALGADRGQYWIGMQEDLSGFVVLRGIVMHLGANLIEPVRGGIVTPGGIYRAGRLDGHDLILFLDLREEGYRDRRWHLFVPRGGEGSIRWEGRDGAGLRYMEALRDYGKKHPRAVESWTFQYPEGIWSYIPSYYT